MSNHLYVRYSDDVEVRQPDEERLIDETLASFERMRRKVFDKHRHAMRGAHAKSHGALKGELTIYNNLPVPLAQGLFREPETYPVIIRFSTAPGDIMPDVVSSFRGMAIKVIRVEGRKFHRARSRCFDSRLFDEQPPGFPAWRCRLATNSGYGI